MANRARQTDTQNPYTGWYYSPTASQHQTSGPRNYYVEWPMKRDPLQKWVII